MLTVAELRSLPQSTCKIMDGLAMSNARFLDAKIKLCRLTTILGRVDSGVALKIQRRPAFLQSVGANHPVSYYSLITVAS